MMAQYVVILMLSMSVCDLANAETSVWKISKEEKHIFLAGTIHVLGVDDYPLPCEFETAYEASENLVFETDMTGLYSPEFSLRYANYFIYPDGSNLKSKLSSETYVMLEDSLQSLGIDADSVMHFRPGTLMGVISKAQLNVNNITAHGVDRYFSERSAEDSKGTGELETLSEHMEFLANIGYGDEENFIRYLLTDVDVDNNVVKFDKMKEAWRNGDLSQLSIYSGLTESARDYPYFYDELIVRRNNKWMPEIERLIDSEGVEFVLVGALHLTERIGLIEKLKEKSYKIEQLKGCEVARDVFGEERMPGYSRLLDAEALYIGIGETEKNFDGAVKAYTESAAQGNPIASAALAKFANNGWLRGRNRFDAIQWATQVIPTLKKMAKGGDARAQYSLGYFYAYAVGVEEDHSIAIEYYEQAANQGHVIAQNNLSTFYYSGGEVDIDLVQAVKWKTLAAEQGYSVAQNDLASWYIYIDELKDYEKGLYWSRRAAEKGQAASIFRLGEMYRMGWGVDNNLKTALEFYQKAANDGYPDSLYQMGRMYRYGWGIDKDVEKSLDWYMKAANQGHAYAQNAIGEIFQFGWGIDKNIQNAIIWHQRAADQGISQSQHALGIIYSANDNLEKSSKWFKAAAEQGYMESQYHLGQAYNLGKGVEKDPLQAIVWHRKAAEQGHPPAQHKMGLYYQTGELISYDFSISLDWYTKAAEQGYSSSIFNIAHLYKNKVIEKPSEEDVERWLAKSLEVGGTQNQNTVAFAYFEGVIVKKNLSKAYRLFLQSAKSGYPKSQNDVGWMLHNGLGVKKNLKQAQFWYKKAINKGNKRAIANLKSLEKIMAKN